MRGRTAALFHHPGRRVRPSLTSPWRRLRRLPRLFLHLAIAWPLAAWICLNRRGDPDARVYRVFSWWCRKALRILGVRVRISGRMPAHGCLVVGNHVSYLDILALAAISPGRFVAKVEMEGWPVFGAIAAWLGTLFIDRNDARASQRVLGEAARILEGGTTVFLFPEGTTSDGSAVGEFYAAPFHAACVSGAPVVPVALRYEDPENPGRPHPLCPFVGDDDLLGHLWRLSAAAPMTLELQFRPPLAAGLKRRELAHLARQEIGEALTQMEQRGTVLPFGKGGRLASGWR